MCLYVSSGIETCRADLTVYKVLKLNNTSPIREFHYLPNTLVRYRKALVLETRSRKFSRFHEPLHWDVIEGGFHTFLTKAQAVHYFGVNPRAPSTRSYKVVKMVIPKGAKMVRGDDDEVVSTSLRTGSLRALKVRGKRSKIPLPY